MNKIMTEDVLQRWVNEIKKDVYQFKNNSLRWSIAFFLFSVGGACSIFFWRNSQVVIGLVIMEGFLLAAAVNFFFNYRSWGKFIRKNINMQKEDVDMQDNEYRKNAREVIGEARWTLGKILPYFVVLIIVGLLILWGLQSAGIISMNIQREVVQHSQGYTESKARLLQKLHTDYLQLETEIAELQNRDDSQQIVLAKRAQQKENLNRMRGEADLLPQSEVPQSVKTFLAKHQ